MRRASFESTNRQVSALFGYPHDEIIGQSIEMLLPERFRDRHLGHRESYVGNVRVRPMGAGLDLYGRRRNGTEFPVEISLSPIEDVGRTLVAAAIRDATDRKRVRAELIMARERGREACHQLAARACRSGARKRRPGQSGQEPLSRHRQSRFASAAADPGIPQRYFATASSTITIALEALSQQDQAISAMSRLLNALLDISKLESGAIRPEPTDFTVAAIFEELRMEFASIAANKGLRLEIEDVRRYAVYSDPSLVEQILRNLVSNAIKYTREGWVRLRCLHEAAVVRIEVLDTGVGIPADQLPYIYDEFYQVGVPTNSSRDGYGLGLAIVQRLVKLLTLQLDVRSEVGRGSAFSLLLPASSVREAIQRTAAGSPLLSPRQIGAARVLLVEDNPAVRRATALLLDLEGYHVTAVASLQEALQHVQTGQGVDLLISDYHLNDGETGTQVIATLREILGVSLRAVLTTGDTSSAIKQLPRDPYLRITSKPIKAEELLTLLRSLLAA